MATNKSVPTCGAPKITSGTTLSGNEAVVDDLRRYHVQDICHPQRAMPQEFATRIDVDQARIGLNIQSDQPSIDFCVGTIVNRQIVDF